MKKKKSNTTTSSRKDEVKEEAVVSALTGHCFKSGERKDAVLTVNALAEGFSRKTERRADKRGKTKKKW